MEGWSGPSSDVGNRIYVIPDIPVFTSLAHLTSKTGSIGKLERRSRSWLCAFWVNLDASIDIKESAAFRGARVKGPNGRKGPQRVS